LSPTRAAAAAAGLGTILVAGAAVVGSPVAEALGAVLLVGGSATIAGDMVRGPATRATAGVAAAVAAVRSRVVSAPPPEPVVEIPPTRDGWYDVAAELRARVVARAAQGPATLHTTAGDLSVAMSTKYGALLEVSGELTVDGATYTIMGCPPRDLRIRNAAGDVLTARDALWDAPAAVVFAAWDIEGEHDEMLMLAAASRATTHLGVDSHGKPEGPWVQKEAVKASFCLRAYAAERIRDHGAREVARTLVADGFTGTVEELLAITEATAASPPSPRGK